MHTHLCTQACTLVLTHGPIHTDTRMHTCAHTDSCTHTHAHLLTHGPMHTHAHLCLYTDHAHTHVHLCSHTDPCTQAHMHICSHTDPCTHTHMHICAHARTYAHRNTEKPTQLHVCTHSCTHTHTQTRFPHTHSPFGPTLPASSTGQVEHLWSGKMETGEVQPLSGRAEGWGNHGLVQG